MEDDEIPVKLVALPYKLVKEPFVACIVLTPVIEPWYKDKVPSVNEPVALIEPLTSKLWKGFCSPTPILFKLITLSKKCLDLLL